MRCTRCGGRATTFFEFSPLDYADRMKLPFRRRFWPRGPCRNCGARGRAELWPLLAVYLSPMSAVAASCLADLTLRRFGFDPRASLWWFVGVGAGGAGLGLASYGLGWWFGRFMFMAEPAGERPAP